MGSGGTIRQGALGWAFVTCLIAVLVGLIGYTVGASDHGGDPGAGRSGHT